MSPNDNILSRVTQMQGRDMPFLPEKPPTWFSKRLLNQYESSSVLRFGPIPIGLAEQLDGMYKQRLDMMGAMLKIKASQIPMFAHEELAPGISICYVAFSPDVTPTQHGEAMNAMSHLTSAWYQEFPDEADQILLWVSKKFDETKGD